MYACEAKQQSGQKKEIANQTQENIKFKMLVQDVKIINQKEETRKASLQDKLNIHDKITTGKSSFALITWGLKSTFKLGANSLLELKNIANHFDGQLLEGSASFKVSSLRSNESLKIRTLLAVVGVRGTSFKVSVLQNKTRVCVSQGQVEISSLKKPEKAMVINPGQAVEVIEKEEEVVLMPSEITPKEVEELETLNNLDNIQEEDLIKSFTKEENEEEIKENPKEEVLLPNKTKKETPKTNLTKKNPVVKKEEPKKVEVVEEPKTEEVLEEEPQEILPMSLEEIKEKYKDVSEITLFSGRILKGAVVKTTDTEYELATEDGKRVIKKSEIKTMKPLN